MKYLLLGDTYQKLFVEDDQRMYSIRYDKNSDKWVHGGTELWDNRLGFDSSEPEDSIYRYGNSDCMEDIVEITKEDAEYFIGKKINEKEATKLLNNLKFI